MSKANTFNLNPIIPQRIMLIGRPGSGKSTFSLKLHHILNIPLYHLDKYFFNAHWIPINYQDFLDLQQNLVDNAQWIIDGNATKSLEIRYSRADICLYFNFPLRLCYWRLFKRFFYKDMAIDDRAYGCYESIRWSLLKYTWGFERRTKPILNQLRLIYPNVQFIELRSDKDVFKLEELLQILMHR